jgi:hypothetical protein
VALPWRDEQRFDRQLAALDLRIDPGDRSPVTDDDLAPLPEPAQRWLRAAGVVGRPRDGSLRVRFRGRFRMRAGQPLMPFEAWQYDLARPVARLMSMRLMAAGVVPMFGTDTYVGGTGRMFGKVLGLVTVADGKGPEFDVGELATWVNDAALLAPSMLLVPAATWTAVDDRRFDLTYTDGASTVTSRLEVGGDDLLCGFRTEDRWYAGVDPPVRAPWRTPIAGWRTTADGRVVATGGGATWELPDGDLTYIEGQWLPDTLRFDVAPDGTKLDGR